MRVLITGGAGFIGHHLVKYVLKKTDWEVVVLDRVDEAGNLNRLSELKEWKKYKHRCSFIWHDLRASINGLLDKQLGDFEYILHVAAASHVDRSIADPLGFVMDNVVGTCNILEFARHKKILKKFMYFSTDEVFGPKIDGRKFDEWDRYHAGSPYSATKAGGEELALAYHNTYKLPVIVTHCMNVFGERQHPEKFIPKVIGHILNEETVPIHSDVTLTLSGTRNYIYADQVSQAVLFILDKGEIGEKYNIEGKEEWSNLDMAMYIAGRMGMKLKYLMIDASDVRPGNDFSYGISGKKLKKMGFKPKGNFIKQLDKVLLWYMDNPAWLNLNIKL